MATYAELYALASKDSALNNRVVVACFVSAETIMSDPSPPANQPNHLVWAQGVFANPKAEAKRMLPAVLAANKDLGVAAIQGASDSAIQTNVDDHVDLFAGS